MKRNYQREWEIYWSHTKRRFFYDVVAWFYRRFLISKLEAYFLKKYFSKGASLLHAGCGGGETDRLVRDYFDITAVDFSRKALVSYRKVNPNARELVLADITKKLPFSSNYFDGVYNLGVLEHYSEDDILKILKEFRRVLKKDGKIIIFWPPEFGSSVLFFKILHRFVSLILPRRKVSFHPTELTRIRSKEHVEKILKLSGFKLLEFYFGIRDFFTYCVIVGKKS